MNPLMFIPQVLNLVANAFGLDTSSDETKVKMAEVELKAQELLAQQMSDQAEINKVEAASSDPFVSRWRPFIGWVCGMAFCYHFILQPFIVFLYTLKTGDVPQLPTFDMQTLSTALMGLLGLGVMRSYDKKNGRG